MLKKALSYSLGLAVGLLAVAPPLDYHIPVVINSFAWLYGCVVAALFGTYLVSTRLPASLKVLVLYLLIGCFISMAPYVSFNAFLLVVVSAWCFLGFIESDMRIVLNMVEAAFWVQVVMTIMQLWGKDKLMNFDRPEPVFFGTVMQYMRFSSMLAVMAPLLILKNRWYLALLAVMCVLSYSSSFGLALISGVAVYFMMTHKREWRFWLVGGIVVGVGYVLWDIGSFRTAFTCGRVRVWEDIVRTWLMDTSHEFILPLSGPIDWKSILFGRGLDTFGPLFVIFKHDLNPFVQAHNDWLQVLWELGILGMSIFVAYFSNLVRRIWSKPILVAGLVCIAVNMFLAFPVRQTQCWLLMIAYVALCEQVARKIDLQGSISGSAVGTHNP